MAGLLDYFANAGGQLNGLLGGVPGYAAQSVNGLLGGIPGQIGGLGVHELQALGLLSAPQQQFQPAPAQFSGGIGNDFGGGQMPPQMAAPGPDDNAGGDVSAVQVNAQRQAAPRLPMPAPNYQPPTLQSVHVNPLSVLARMVIHADTPAEAALQERQLALAPAMAQFQANQLAQKDALYADPIQRANFRMDPTGQLANERAIALEQGKPITAKLNERIVTPNGNLPTNAAPGEITATTGGALINSATGKTGQNVPVPATAGPGAVSGLVGAKGSGAPGVISGGQPSRPFFDAKTNSYMQFDAQGNLVKVAPGNYNPEDARKGVLGSDQYKEYNNIAGAYNSVAKIYNSIKGENGFKQLSVLDNLVRAQTGLSAKQGSMQMMFHEQGALDQLSNALGKGFLNAPITPGNIAKAVHVLGGYATSKQKSLNSFINQEETRARQETGNPNFTFGIQPEPLAPFVQVGNQRVQTNTSNGDVQPRVTLPPHIPPPESRPVGNYQTPKGVKYWDGQAWH